MLTILAFQVGPRLLREGAPTAEIVRERGVSGVGEGVSGVGNQHQRF